MYISEKLATYAYDLSYNDLPVKVIKRAKLSLLDYVSCLLAGNKWGLISPILKKYIIEQGGKEESSIIGTQKKAPANFAAFVNGAISHSIDLDDGHRFATSHPGSVIFPSVLATAEKNESSGKDIILSTVLGYDIMLRIAMAINPSHLFRGFHTTSTCGSIGSSTAVSKLLGLNKKQLGYAISIAALQGAGLQEMLHGNPMIKPLQVGKSSQSGLISAELVKMGARGPLSIFEGKHGFFKAMSDKVNELLIFKDIGSKFEIEKTYFKFYPTCRHIHPSLDLTEKLMRKNNIDINKIKKIEIETYRVAIDETGNIFHPKTIDEAMFSMPYALAVMFFKGSFQYNDLVKHIANVKINEIIEKIELRATPAFDDNYPMLRGASLKVTLNDGATYEEYEKLPLGEPETINPKMIKDKYFTIMSTIGMDNLSDSIFNIIDEIENDNSSFQELMQILRKININE